MGSEARVEARPVGGRRLGRERARRRRRARSRRTPRRRRGSAPSRAARRASTRRFSASAADPAPSGRGTRGEASPPGRSRTPRRVAERQLAARVLGDVGEAEVGCASAPSRTNEATRPSEGGEEAFRADSRRRRRPRTPAMPPASGRVDDEPEGEDERGRPSSGNGSALRVGVRRVLRRALRDERVLLGDEDTVSELALHGDVPPVLKRSGTEPW